jgi:hypothetical protein
MYRDKQMRQCLMAFLCVFPLAHADAAQPVEDLSLDAAIKLSATGETDGLVAYAGALRTGVMMGLISIYGNELVDSHADLAAAEKKDPLMRDIKCVGKLDPKGLVLKALQSHQKTSWPFSNALWGAISALCPPPENFSITYAVPQSQLAQVPEWISLSKSTDGNTETLVNPSSIRVEDHIRQAWGKLVFQPGTKRGIDDDSDKWQATGMIHVAVDCTEDRYKIDGKIISYDDGSSKTAPPKSSSQSWEPIPPDSSLRVLSNYICAWIKK